MKENKMNEFIVEARLLEARFKIEGMLAENKHRELCGNSLAYTEEQFLEVLDESKLTYNDIMSTLKNGW